MLKFLKKQTASNIVVDDLEQAKIDLLRSQLANEYWDAQVIMLASRVERLEEAVKKASK